VISRFPQFPNEPEHACGDKPRIAYDRALNPAQLSAVTHGNGPLLVIAGAGSGKTRTLVYRVARLVQEGVPPEAILLLSFTRKASQEMIKRASNLLDNRCQKVSGGTFHSFAHTVLKRHADKIGFEKGFSILDRSDSEDLIGLILREMPPGHDNQKLPRKSTLATIFSQSVNKGLPLEDVIYDAYPHFGSLLDAIHSICEQYHHRKREHCFCDYDDLLIYLLQLLTMDEAVRTRLSDQYQHILVDEYQDTNPMQADIISMLANPSKNVMVVGDDSQSIYAFRGASFKNIITFPDRFPGTRIIKLEENYRSLQPILDLTNAIIDEAAEKYSKHLFTQRGGGRLPALVAAVSEHAQSQYVAAEINRLFNQGVALQDMAVLFRAGFHSFDLELELTRAGIPFAKFGGFKFTEAAHIKDMLAHLKIFCTPNDRLSWYRVLLLVNGIGAKTAQQIYDAAINQNCGAAGLLNIPLKTKIAATLTPLMTLVADLNAGDWPIHQMGEQILTYYLPALKTRYDDHPRRLRDLQQLLSVMERYDTAADFLADMALEPPNTSIEGRLAADHLDEGDRLNLSTVHSAKGLEWHSVFVIWALDGRFPSHHAMDRPEAIEEERRLMYVAATRARENLYITYPSNIYDRSTQSVLYRPSRFLADIADDLLDKHYFNPAN
jgi:DNA helicase II / ATP-dependent DNA helicase PcrA